MVLAVLPDVVRQALRRDPAEAERALPISSRERGRGSCRMVLARGAKFADPQLPRHDESTLGGRAELMDWVVGNESGCSLDLARGLATYYIYVLADVQNLCACGCSRRTKFMCLRTLTIYA